MRINKKAVYFKSFSEHINVFAMNLLDKSGKVKSWHVFKTEYNVNHTFCFQWLQLTDAIPKAWENVQNNTNNNGSLKIKDRYILKRTGTFSINKLTTRELYSTLVSNIEVNLHLKYIFENVPKKTYQIGQNISANTQSYIFAMLLM